VAILINAILSYQQLNGIADSLIAMQRLHMDATGFTLMRAVLVVAVAILVSLFCRNRETLARVQPVPSVQVQAASQVSAMIEGTAQSVTSMDVHPARVHAAEQETPIETPVQEDMDTDRIRVFPVHSVPPQAEQECTGETIEEQVRKLLSEQPGISVRKLANALNMPPSTANNWIKRVRNQQTEEVG
jgi:transcriptional regulator of acetoin/glycerol metabolism